jgi:DNA-directed RNA polymerase specialized sigma24 family protein
LGPVKDPVAAAGLQKDWSSPSGVFQRFLNWLDGGLDSGGEKYLETRRRLVLYFDRKNCVSADELADETLSRVARRLAEEGQITNVPPVQYCYMVARYVLLEYQRRPAQKEISIEVLGCASLPFGTCPTEPDTAEAEAKRLHCLETCLQKLQRDYRELILEYYRGEGRVKIECRRRLAERLGVTTNALSIRACRIRERLEKCVRTCYGGK